MPCGGSTLPKDGWLLLPHQETGLYHTGCPFDSTMLSPYLLLHFPGHLHSWLASRGVSGLQRRVIRISTSPLDIFHTSREGQRAEIRPLQLSWVTFGSLYYFFKVLGCKCYGFNAFQMRSAHADGQLEDLGAGCPQRLGMSPSGWRLPNLGMLGESGGFAALRRGA